MRRITQWKMKLCITAAVLVYAVAAYVGGWGCVIFRITGYPCPGCGMTRALLAVLRMDLTEAFALHPMFWSVPILYFCFLTDGRLFPQKWMNILMYVLLVMGFIFQWLYKISL